MCTSTFFASDPYSYMYSYTHISPQNQRVDMPIRQVYGASGFVGGFSIV